MFRIITLISLLLSISAPSLSYGMNTEVGRIILSIGNNVVMRGKHQLPLRRGLTIHQGDLVSTGENGRMELKLLDSSRYSLQENSTLKIERFHFSADQPDQNQVILELAKGGMRTLSGLIGKQHPDAFQLKAAVAIIGIRGTLWETIICDSDCAKQTGTAGVTGKVLQGVIQVSSDVQQKIIQTNQFFFVTSSNGLVEQLNTAPPAYLQNQQKTTAKDQQRQANQQQKQKNQWQQALKQQSKPITNNTQSSNALLNTLNRMELPSTIQQRVDQLLDAKTTLYTQITKAKAAADLLIEQAALLDKNSAEYHQLIKEANLLYQTANELLQKDADLGVAISQLAQQVNDYLKEQNSLSDQPVVSATAPIDDSVSPRLISSRSYNTRLLNSQNCSSCAIDNSSELASHVGSVTDQQATVFWGRWNGEIDGLEATEELIHYIYSNNNTPYETLQSMTGSYRYQFTDGTRPTAEAGQLGEVNSGELRIDFASQQLISANLNLSFADGRLVEVSESAPTEIQSLLAGNPLSLQANCHGGGCGSQLLMSGEMTLQLSGPTAERALTAYSVKSTTESLPLSANGVAVFEKQNN